AGVRERQFQSAGSGVVVDAKRGYIVTNAHVVDNAKEITVTLFDERELAAKIVGSDPRTDIAVIQVTPERLTEISLGDSDRLEPGDYVAAIGNPFGLQHSVSSGIVSALGRSGLNPDGYESLIQTDASINPGNSGGALVNLRGELVGINNMILSGSGGNIGIGFAIPANMARSVMQQLIEFGAVKRGQLGVAVASLTPDVAQALGLPNGSGAVINQVAADSAAARAGLRAGDVVTTVNGKTVKSAADFRNAIGLLRVGDKVEVAVLRDGQTRRLSALIPEPPAVAKANELASSEAANGLHAVACSSGGDMHDLGIRMVSDLLETEGWSVECLGANMPTPDVVEAVGPQPHRGPSDLLLVSAGTPLAIRGVASLIGAVRQTLGKSAPATLVGGMPFHLAPNLWKKVGADGFSARAGLASAAGLELVRGRRS
ncbi:MAG: PDZ domain-containing protein, partial [Gammaproteobacteria bacterium]|nr:PDZ domain-containing protein [Gammaproteobacteria bacterium]